MLSKNKNKWIRSLEMKKYRNETGCFLAEGNKLVADIIPFFDCELLVARASWLATQGDIQTRELIMAEDGDIEKVSLLKTPQDVLAVFKQPTYLLDEDSLKSKLSFVLDGVQDPGNLGTIIRLADWFGIEDVICSPDSADIYNPKTIQATMGAIARVKTHYTDLSGFLSRMQPIPIFGTFLDGNNIYTQTLSSTGLIVMGNEGNGIREELEPFISNRLYLPSYPENKKTADSLNVALATAITCAEFRRISF